MSAQLSALFGVVVGALLAGGSSLLLTWRNETIQGRTGVHLIREILREARDEVARLTEEGAEAAWRADQLPDSRLWAQYRAAVSARLPLATLQKVDKAMRTLDALNVAAARAWELDAELRRQALKAVLDDKPDSIEKLRKLHLEDLTEADHAVLEPASRNIGVALTAVEKRAPSGRRDFASLLPWGRWHARSLAAGLAVVIVAVVAALGIIGGSTSEVVETQNALSAHLGTPEMTACEHIHDSEDGFTCLAVEAPTATACPVVETGETGWRHELISENTAPNAGGEPCAIDLARRFFAERAQKANCTTFFRVGKSVGVSAEELKKPGFLAKLKAQLRSEESPAEVPAVIRPGTSFTADC